jgi:hypothetical protein
MPWGEAEMYRTVAWRRGMPDGLSPEEVAEMGNVHRKFRGSLAELFGKPTKGPPASGDPQTRSGGTPTPAPLSPPTTEKKENPESVPPPSK